MSEADSMSEADPIKALAIFMSVSQPHLSILISMPGNERLAKAWNDARNALGLRGWHDDAEAEKEIRRRLRIAKVPTKKEKKT